MVAPTREIDSFQRLALTWDRARAFGLMGVVLGLNGFAGAIVGSIDPSHLFQPVLTLGGISAIVWFALNALIMIGIEKGPFIATTRVDRIVLAAMFLLALLPLNLAASLGLLLGSLVLAVTSSPNTRERRVAVVMFAVTGPLIWGRLALALLGPSLLAMDAHLAGLLAGVPVHSNVMQFFDARGVLYVALGCSSVHNMSLAVLLFVTLTQVLRVRFTPRLVAACLFSAAAMALVNISRLAAMARYPEDFEYLHSGAGGQLFGLASFVLAGCFAGFGIVVAVRRS